MLLATAGGLCDDGQGLIIEGQANGPKDRDAAPSGRNLEASSSLLEASTLRARIIARHVVAWQASSHYSRGVVVLQHLAWVGPFGPIIIEVMKTITSVIIIAVVTQPSRSLL
jgi:hypothetical protein